MYSFDLNQLRPAQVKYCTRKLNEEDGSLELHKDKLVSEFPFLGCTNIHSINLLDAKGKIRNGMGIHPDEIFEYGRPVMVSGSCHVSRVCKYECSTS